MADVAGVVTTHDPASGRVRWRSYLSAPLDTGPQAQGNTIVTLDRDGNVVALDSATGARRWSRPIRAALFEPAVGADIVDNSIKRVTVQYDAARSGQLGWCFYALARP